MSWVCHIYYYNNSNEMLPNKSTEFLYLFIWLGSRKSWTGIFGRFSSSESLERFRNIRSFCQICVTHFPGRLLLISESGLNFRWHISRLSIALLSVSIVCRSGFGLSKSFASRHVTNTTNRRITLQAIALYLDRISANNSTQSLFSWLFYWIRVQSLIHVVIMSHLISYCVHQIEIGLLPGWLVSGLK